MSYNNAYGGTIDFSKNKWEKWYKRWIESASKEYFYRYLQNNDIKEFVGEVAYHFDKNKNIFICDIIILAKFRGQGYGTTGLNLLCDSFVRFISSHLIYGIIISLFAINIGIDKCVIIC